MLDEVGDAQNKFRIPPGNNDQTLIATGKAFAADAVAHKTLFLDHGMPSTFISDLQAKTNTFEQTVAEAGTAHGERVGTNAAFSEPARTGKRLVDKLAPDRVN